jgi:phosphatidylglycerophosphatase A
MNPRTEAISAPPTEKPWLAYWIATAFGLGYLPKAPGTAGSLAGVALAWSVWKYTAYEFEPARSAATQLFPRASFFAGEALIAVILAIAGVWAADCVAKFSGQKDPQFVIVDEVSGQTLTYVLGFVPANWKYLLLGLILFRVFDIWKPFPARRAESLRGGWGVMSDDWIAAGYAALVLWLARAAHL